MTFAQKLHCTKTGVRTNRINASSANDSLLMGVRGAEFHFHSIVSGSHVAVSSSLHVCCLRAACNFCAPPVGCTIADLLSSCGYIFSSNITEHKPLTLLCADDVCLNDHHCR